MPGSVRRIDQWQEASVTKPRKDDQIVSSRHLAETEAWQVSEFEYGLIMTFNAFSRWTLKCMSAAGYAELAALDILVLHHVHHRDKPKRLNDIAFALNIEDMHTVNYALRKLLKQGLIVGEKTGKEVYYRTTEQGKACCLDYKEVRERCLNQALMALRIEPADFRDIADSLRVISGVYDQASRAASSM